jgi:hypothetical protein
MLPVAAHFAEKAPLAAPREQVADHREGQHRGVATSQGRPQSRQDPHHPAPLGVIDTQQTPTNESVSANRGGAATAVVARHSSYACWDTS